MSQLTVYMPPAVERELKKRAKAEGLSVSAYLTGLVRRETMPSTWPNSFLATFGAFKGSPLSEPEELPFERRRRLK